MVSFYFCSCFGEPPEFASPADNSRATLYLLVKQIKAQKGLDPAQLAPYLSLENCLDGMQVLIQQLFGIQMQEEPMQDEERWDSVVGLQPPPFEERIRKFVFTDDEERNLGTMYLDLHPRKGKYTHAAHFTVRCGCVVDGPDSEYQSPIVALVCNMNTGEASFSSHQEVETLFHEFGHALHSLLSRTNFQHMSGTRAAMDFVETPSHLMENYVWDPQFLPMLARTTSGEPIPESMIQSLRESHKLFKCLEMQNQIVLAMFDQHIFGAPSSASTTDIWSGLHRQHAVPYAEGTHWHSNVGHLVTYGAGYYGYLYSQVFASDIWNQLFQEQSLERKSGEQIWKKMLIHGGARDANLMLKDLLGREPTVENFLKTLKV
jgi:intermediate peptidase